MLRTNVTDRQATGAAGLSIALALVAGVLPAACAAAPAMDMTPELRDAAAVTSRQIAVTVGLKGELGWQGRQVSAGELGDLMREAAMGSTPLLLVVVPASGDVRYGDVAGVMQMAQARGIEARIAEPKVSTE